MATPLHETSAPEIPPMALWSSAVRKREEKIDRQMKDSFPASDPPSFSGGKHAIGAPENRESESPTPDTHAVKAAEKKVKSGAAGDGKY